jgi:hypothetical protein
MEIKNKKMKKTFMKKLDLQNNPAEKYFKPKQTANINKSIVFRNKKSACTAAYAAKFV